MLVDFTAYDVADQIKAINSLMMVMDPELEINIIDMGLVYFLDFSTSNKLKVRLTLTSPHCPMAESIVNGVERSLKHSFPEKEIIIELVWEPAWSTKRMTEAGLEQLNRK